MCKPAMISLVLTAFCLVLATGCAAEKVKPLSASLGDLPHDESVHSYVNAMRADLSRGKVRIITEVMKLNSEEAKVFWPIYHDYESELFELSDRRIDVIHRFVEDQLNGRLDDNEASRLASEYFAFESKRLDLIKTYCEMISKRLSPARAAQFTQIEHRVNTVIDLLIASELPLISVEGR